jgi:hypothetical protein
MLGPIEGLPSAARLSHSPLLYLVALHCLKNNSKRSPNDLFAVGKLGLRMQVSVIAVVLHVVNRLQDTPRSPK